MLLDSTEEIVPRRRAPKKRRTFEENFDHLTEEQFREYFRMNRFTFLTLTNRLRSHMSAYDATQLKKEARLNRNGGTIQASVKLAVFIRILAGSPVDDMWIIFGIGRSTVYAIISDMIKRTRSFI